MDKKIIPRSGARVEHFVMRRHSLETSPQRESPLPIVNSVMGPGPSMRPCTTRCGGWSKRATSNRSMSARSAQPHPDPRVVA
jgi:hypothetical protein